jgi:hypothetical protein
MRSGRPWGPCSSCLATSPVLGASIASELSGLLWCSSLSPSRYRLRRQCWMIGGSTVVVEEVGICRGVPCCCLACVPIRKQDDSAFLIQELICLENEGYTILRNLLAAYQITRCQRGRPLSSDSYPLLVGNSVTHRSLLSPYSG